MAYQLVSEFKGYRNKRDKTNLPPGYLIAGSKNVISTDGDLIATRPGYELYGAANSSLTPIESSYETITNRSVQIALRSYDDELEFLYNDTWYRLADSWAAVDFNFAKYYDTTEQLDLVLFVVGDSNIYAWNGAVTTIASTTANTITKSGIETWAEGSFYASGNKTVIINGTEYTYTGGESTTTLTGVSPDPTGEADGSVVFQKIVTNTNKPASGLENDLIEVLDNQVYVASTKRNQVYVSHVNDYTTYTFSSPRAVGEGALLTLDAAPTALLPQEKYMYISAGKSYWYQTAFTLSSDNTNEALGVERLKSGVSQAAKAQSMTGNVKDYVFFITNEPTLEQLGRIQDIDTPQSKPLSDDIKLDFDSYDFTGAHLKFFKNNVYIAVPVQSLLLIYNLSKNYWEAPQVLPAGRLAIIDDKLYLHSNTVPETYKLSFGLPVDQQVHNDNGFAMEAIARFSYMNYGLRANKKTYTDFYVEFYISSNTELTRKDFFEYQGVEAVETEIYLGSDQWALFDTAGGGIGKENLGKSKLAGGAGTDNLKKYRKVDQSPERDFYEMFTQFSSNSIDQQWAILSFGPDIAQSPNENFEISS